MLALMQVRGDYEIIWKSYGFPHWQSHNVCGFCPANRSDMPWNSFLISAGWISLNYTLEHWMLQPWIVDHPLYDVPGIIVFSIMLDILHVCDKGVTVHILGNCIFMLINHNPQIGGLAF